MNDMKRGYIFIMVALLALVGCSKSNEMNSSQRDELRITSAISTRASGQVWGEKDEIGVYMAESGTTNYFEDENSLYSITSGGSNGEFTSSSPLYYPVTGYVDILAYYPYSDALVAPTAYGVDVTCQSDLAAIDLMIASKSRVASTSQALELNFEHKLSQLNLTIKLSDGTDLDLTKMSVKLLGTSPTANYDLRAGDSDSPISDLGTTTQISLTTNGTGSSVEAIVIPQSLSGAMLLFDFESGESLTATITTTSFAIGQSYNYTATLSRAKVDLSSATIGSWDDGNSDDDSDDDVLGASPAYSYLEFKRGEIDTNNLTKVDDAGVIESLLSQFRRCLMTSTDGIATICYLDDSNSTLYADGSAATLTGAEGDVMVYFPEYWYMYESVDDNTFRYYFSQCALDGYVRVEASLVGAYKAYCDGTYLYSRSGVTPKVSASQTGFKGYAAARGADSGYQIIDYEQHCTIAMMLYAKYLDRNLQSVLGAGGSLYSYTTGLTNSLGNVDGSATWINGLGLEGVYGVMYEWVDGVSVSNNVWTIFNPTDGTTRTVQAGNANGNITAMAIEGYSTISGEVGYSDSATQYFDMVPTAASEYTTNCYADKYWQKSGGDYVLTRSGNGSESWCGVACANVDNSATTSYDFMGSRLAFRGTITQAADVAAYKALFRD